MKKVALGIKRIADVLTAMIFGLILLVPMLMIAICIRVTMGSPIIFRQQRPGYHREVFTILKFRTMSERTSLEELSHGNRITKFGKTLRASSLDELPQLVNIFKGEMSFIGPRPTTVENDRYFTESECQRYFMRPGLSGWAQVNGRNKLRWNERLSLDVWYVQHWSLWLDFMISLKTVMVIFNRKGFDTDETTVSGRIADERGNMPEV